LEAIDKKNVTDIEQMMRPGKDLMPKFEEDGMGP
jgi:hypothetical protein